MQEPTTETTSGRRSTTRAPSTITFTQLLEDVYQDAHGYGSFAGEFEVTGYVEISAMTGGLLARHGRVAYTSFDEF